MENENTNIQQPQGWKDVIITPEMPLAAIVHFLNILNQRLCTIEDNLMLEMENGEKLSISELYRLQALEESNRANQEENKGE